MTPFLPSTMMSGKHTGKAKLRLCFCCASLLSAVSKSRTCLAMALLKAVMSCLCLSRTDSDTTQLCTGICMAHCPSGAMQMS